MVKVLENHLVDLDLLPGHAQIDAQKQFREQMQNAKTAAGQVSDGEAGNPGDAQLPAGSKAVVDQRGFVQGFQLPRDLLPEGKQRDEARGFAGTIVDGSGKVIGGLAGSVGGLLKGVGDLGANTVYTVATGLGQTGSGVVNGATAPFAKEEVSEIPGQNTEDAQNEARKPRKIEIRSGEASEKLGETAVDESNAEK